MSVQLTSLNGEYDNNISNGSFRASIEATRAYGEEIPAWNGAHDGQCWTAAHCATISERLKQLGALADSFADLAGNGGVRIS